MTEKIEIRMRKHHSPHMVRFHSDPEDSHFINVDLVKYATGEVKASHYIIFADLATWVRWYRDDGFCPVEDDPRPERATRKKRINEKV